MSDHDGDWYDAEGLDDVPHVEMFQEDETKLWGAQCFTCHRIVTTGLPSLGAAEAAADEHECPVPA